MGKLKRPVFTVALTSVIASLWFYSCTKDIGKNPLLPYSDDALLDSAKNETALVYYKNDPNAIYSGTNGPHGAFKLKFNTIANSALTDNGKLPIGQKFPDGSFVVKEVLATGIYAMMYKKEGVWLWSEVASNGDIVHSVNADAGTACIGCHSQSGQRDLVVSFNFY